MDLQNREIFFTIIFSVCWSAFLLWLSKFYLVQAFILNKWEMHFNNALPNVRRIMAFLQFFYPDFIFDILKCNRTNAAANSLTKNLFFVLVIVLLLFANSFSILYFQPVNSSIKNLEIVVFSHSIILPIIVGTSGYVTFGYYFGWLTFCFGILNGFSNKLYKHSELENRLRHSMIVIKGLPSNNFKVKQLDEENVLIEIHDGTTIAEFKALKPKIKWAGGLDILHITAIVSGQIQIKCKIATESLEEIWSQNNSGGLTLSKVSETTYQNDQLFYLMFDPDKPATGCIKIGVSKEPQAQRLKTLRTGAPKIRIIWEAPQTDDFNEDIVKESFSDLRDELEWYDIKLLDRLQIPRPKEFQNVENQ